MNQSPFRLFALSALLTLTAGAPAFANGGQGNQGGNKTFGASTQYRRPHYRYPRRPRYYYSTQPGNQVVRLNVAAPKVAASADVYNLKCSLEGEAVQEIQAVNVNVKEGNNGRFQIWGNIVNAQARSLPLNVMASGALIENVALTLDGGAGEITLRTEKDDKGEEYLLGKIRLLGLSDEEGLSCVLNEVGN